MHILAEVSQVFCNILTDMGWAAREISSDEVEGLRCFLCACDISAFVPREFAADVDCPTKILGRSESLEGSESSANIRAVEHRGRLRMPLLYVAAVAATMSLLLWRRCIVQRVVYPELYDYMIDDDTSFTHMRMR